MKICREGWPFILGPLAAAALFCGLAAGFGSPLCGFVGGVALLAAAFCAYFFRDPPRVILTGERLVLSPADGTVMEVIEAQDSSSPVPVWVIRIFLSVFDPHLQRAPLAGTVRAVRYQKGKFLDARDPQAAFENEQNRMEFQPASPAFVSPIVVTQIAGLIARRIICDVREGQNLRAGERLGLIRFGSQVDVVMPKNVMVRVKAGDYVRAGIQVLGEAPQA